MRVRVLLLLLLLAGQVVPDSAGMSSEKLALIDRVVEQAIADGKLPGCVVLVGRGEQIVYRKAFGHRALEPSPEPMTAETVFDLASLTKVVATAPSIMLLVERGQLRLSDPISLYLPEIQDPQARRITLQELLTHTSGYGAGLDRTRDWQGQDGAARELARELVRHPPGTHFEYSDINYIALGLIVHRVSGQSLREFARANLYRPLAMARTDFGPRLEPEVAPTERRAGAILRGTVHDHVAARMGGVAGHAGLFSTADDLALYCQAVLAGRALAPATLARMIRPVVVDRQGHTRGLGWDLDTGYSSNRGELFPRGSFGHTGFTGTSLWIDPASRIYVVFLSNRVHPDGQGDVIGLRARVATIAASAASDGETAWREREEAYAAEVQLAMPAFLARQVERESPPLASRRTLNGIDILRENGFREVQGLALGLVTNDTGRSKSGTSTIDLLHRNARLTRLFLWDNVPGGVDPGAALPVISLDKKLSRQDLEGLDALVFDIQDCGARFSPYGTTLQLVLEACAEGGIPLFVLDRPNPIGGEAEGPVSQRDSTLPVRHGLTPGELARLLNAERKIGADLRVIAMDPWARGLMFDQTQQVWVPPSPDLRSLAAALIYPGLGLWEAANLSVGRGTDRPFEQLGAPWLDAPRLAMLLNESGLEGVRFVPTRFTPTSSKFAGELCQGVQIFVTDRERFRPVRMGVEIASLLLRLHPDQLETDKMGVWLDNDEVLRRLLAGESPAELERSWMRELNEFRVRRTPYLLY